MAEFTFSEVMNEWKRMCNYMCKTGKCRPEGCPLNRVDSHDPCAAIYETRFIDMNYEKIASIIMDWAIKNPEPVYPTWGKYIEDNYGCKTCGAMAATRMSKEDAEKLGVKPIGE